MMLEETETKLYVQEFRSQKSNDIKANDLQI